MLLLVWLMLRAIEILDLIVAYALVDGGATRLPRVGAAAHDRRRGVVGVVVVVGARVREEVGLDEPAYVVDALLVERLLVLDVLVERLAGHVVADELVQREYLVEYLGGEDHRRRRDVLGRRDLRLVEQLQVVLAAHSFVGCSRGRHRRANDVHLTCLVCFFYCSNHKTLRNCKKKCKLFQYTLQLEINISSNPLDVYSW